MTKYQEEQYSNLINSYDLKGPEEIYSITVKCDKARIDKIESTLKGEDIHIIDYQYNIFLQIKEHNITKVFVEDLNETTKLRVCIENEIFNTIKIKKLPKKGLVPISIKFPAFITKKTETKNIEITGTKKTETRNIGISGSVYGKQPKHCFSFKAPKNWVLDVTSGASRKLPAVFYYQNTKWETAETFMYAKTAVYSEKIKSIQNQVDETVKIWKKSFGYNKKVIFIENIVTKNNTSGKIYFFPQNDNRDSNEYVAYFLGKNTINFFVLHTSDKNHKKLLPILKELALTYIESDDCNNCCEKDN
jgi:hypothetical protein